MTDEELNGVLKDRLNEDFQKFRMQGILIGWNSCCRALYEECKSMTSAKAIKQLLKQKCDEANERLHLDKSEPSL